MERVADGPEIAVIKRTFNGNEGGSVACRKESWEWDSICNFSSKYSDAVIKLGLDLRRTHHVDETIFEANLKEFDVDICSRQFGKFRRRHVA